MSVAVTGSVPVVAPEPVVPRYEGACLSNLVPALRIHHHAGQGWVPDEVLSARQVVLVVIDGLGWDQLQERRALAPTLSSLAATSITTVAPSTTATALTSLTTGTAPGEHGVVGYRIRVGGQVMNALRWTTPAGDVRDSVVPEEFQPIDPFAGGPATVISRVEFAGSGFTRAHLRGVDLAGYWTASSIPVEVRDALDAGVPLVYAYYDGIDKIAHATGLGAHYDAELAMVDALVARIIDVLPEGVALAVTADHGQVEVGGRIETLAPEVMAATRAWSGEARFVWLHARGGRRDELLSVAAEAHGHHAWVRGIDQILDEGWFGPSVGGVARARLGDVAVVPWEPIALVPSDQLGPPLIGRHGSLTAAEMVVPLLTTVS